MLCYRQQLFNLLQTQIVAVAYSRYDEPIFIMKRYFQPLNTCVIGFTLFSVCRYMSFSKTESMAEVAQAAAGGLQDATAIATDVADTVTTQRQCTIEVTNACSIYALSEPW